MTIIYYDLETTGLNNQNRHKGVQIVSIGAVTEHGSRFHRYIIPTCQITAEATAIHGIRLRKDRRLFKKRKWKQNALHPKDGLQLFEVKLSKPPEKSEKVQESSSSSTPRKESVYAKMVSLRRRTTSRDLRRILSGPSAAKNQEKRSRIQSEPTNAKEASSSTNSPSPSSQLKITDLKDFNKLTASSSNNSLKDSSPSEDPFDHDNIGYLNGNSSNDNSASISKYKKSLKVKN